MGFNSGFKDLKKQRDSCSISLSEKLIDFKIEKIVSFYWNISFITVFKRPLKTFSKWALPTFYALKHKFLYRFSSIRFEEKIDT